jgi:hypothetical protein
MQENDMNNKTDARVALADWLDDLAVDYLDGHGHTIAITKAKELRALATPAADPDLCIHEEHPADGCAKCAVLPAADAGDGERICLEPTLRAERDRLIQTLSRPAADSEAVSK